VYFRFSHRLTSFPPLFSIFHSWFCLGIFAARCLFHLYFGFFLRSSRWLWFFLPPSANARLLRKMVGLQLLSFTWFWAPAHSPLFDWGCDPSLLIEAPTSFPSVGFITLFSFFPVSFQAQLGQPLFNFYSFSLEFFFYGLSSVLIQRAIQAVFRRFGASFLDTCFTPSFFK